jgi:hypothetical protein
MISKIVTDYLRDLAERLQMVAPIGVGVDTGDVRQLIDLADTLDEARDPANDHKRLDTALRRIDEEMK